MAGSIRLFEKDRTGLLVEVDPSKADVERATRRFGSMSVTIDVLFTPEEEAARDAEEAAEAAKEPTVMPEPVEAQIAALKSQIEQMAAKG